jgi:hypothetical protein
MSTDTVGGPGDVAEFSAFLERYHTDVALRQLHFLRVMMGSFFAVLVVAWNYFRLAGQVADGRVSRIAEVVCALHVLACLVTLLVTQRKFINEFSRDVASLRERAWQVAQFVHRRGNILLLLAFTGQVLVLLGTLFRLHLFATDGEVLLIALVPTALLVVHGLGEIPTRHRLCRLYAYLTSRTRGGLAGSASG